MKMLVKKWGKQRGRAIPALSMAAASSWSTEPSTFARGRVGSSSNRSRPTLNDRGAAQSDAPRTFPEDIDFATAGGARHVVKGDYIPDAGDLVWLHSDPQAGHEQAERRPALVLHARPIQWAEGEAICCPMTTKIKGYGVEVVVSRRPPSAGLADQIRSLDRVPAGPSARRGLSRVSWLESAPRSSSLGPTL